MEVDAILAAADSDSDSDLNTDEHLLRIEDILNETTSDDDDNLLESAIEFENAKADALKSTLELINSPLSINGHEGGGSAIPSSSLIFDEGLEPIPNMEINMVFSSDELEKIIHSVDLEDTANSYDNRYDRYTFSSPFSRHDKEERETTAHHIPLSPLGCVPRSFNSSPLTCTNHEDSTPPSSPVSKVEAFELKSFREDQRLVVNPLEVKRRMRLSTGQGTPQVRGGAIRMETLRHISETLSSKGVQSSKTTSEPGTADNNSQRPGLGSGTCIAVHLKFIVIGTSMGALMLFDHFQELRHILGPCNPPGQTLRFDPITSIVMLESFKGSTTGDFLVSGSAGGCIILWDYIKGTVLRVVDDAHSAPIVSIQCLRGYPAVVTCDCKGMVNKISFRRVMWSAWIADVLCLLDGTAGIIQSMSVLSCTTSSGCLKSSGASSVTPTAAIPSTTFKSAVKGLSATLSNTSSSSSFPDESKNNNTIHSAQPQSDNNTASNRSPPSTPRTATAAVSSATASRGESMCEHLLAMCSKKSTFVIAMQPTVKVIFKWPSPVAANGVKKLHSHAHVVWRHKIKKKEPGSEIDKAGTSLFDDPHAILIRSWGCSIQSVRLLRDDNNSSVPTFERCHNITVGDPILAIECINHRIIAYLTEKMTVHIRYLDAEMTELHKFFVGQYNLVSHPISSSLHPNVDYTGSFRACDQLYLLGSDSLTTICVSSWKQRINTLVAAGEWLEALTVSLDHFQKIPEPYNNRDLAFATTLLLRYVKLAVENAPHGPSSSSQPSKLPQVLDLVSSHFEMLAGVCIEYSAITQQLGCLFGEIFSQFVATGQLNVFLTILGPYIMTGRVKWLPVDALLSLTQFHEERKSMRSVEHCIMSLDKMGEREGQELDIGAVLDVLQQHHLWAGLLNVCSIGLNDYLSAFEALLQLLMEKADLAHSNFEIMEYSEDAPPSPEKSLSSPPHAVEYPGDHEFEYLGYLLLVYLRRCLQGKGFLFGEIPSEILPRVRAQLLYLLCQRVSCASGVGNIKLENVHHLNGLGINNTIWRASTYPYLRILLYMDPEATLKVISSVLDMPDAQFNDDSSITLSSDLDEYSIYEDQETLAAVAVDMGVTKCPGRRCIIIAVASVLAPEIAGEVKRTTHILPNCRDGSPWPQSCKPFLFDFISKYLELSLVQLPGQFVNVVLTYILTERSNKPNAQSQLMAILQHVPIPTINSDALLPLMVEAHFFRAAVFLLRSSPLSPSKFAEMLTYYLQDTTSDFCQQIFNLIRSESPHVTALGGDILGTIGPILASLVELDTSSCVRLICDMGWSHDWALEKLGDHSRLKFQYLDVLFRQAKELVHGGYSPELNEDTGDLVDEVSSSSEALSEHQQSQYIELLIQFEPQSVFTYLSTSDGYNLEKCLDLCRTHGVLDATAYLLEKNGDVGGALDLSISSIDEKVLRLKVALHSLDVEALVVEKKMRHTSLHAPSTIFSCTAEGRDLSNSVDFVIDLCRNYKRGGNDSYASLWLATLDKLISLKTIALSESYKRVEIVLGILDALIQRLLDAMSVELPLPDILNALLVCHSERSLGEFRELFISILDSAVYERTIYCVATSLLFNDVLSLAHRRHCLVRGGVHAHLGVEDRIFLAGGGATIGSTCNGRVTIDVVDKSRDVLIRRRLDNEEARRVLSNTRMRQAVAKVGMSGCNNLTPSLQKEPKRHVAQYSQTSIADGGWLSAGISVGGAWSEEARKGIVSAVPRFMGTLREKRKQSK